MKIRIKRALLCFLAAASLSASVNICTTSADEEDTQAEKILEDEETSDEDGEDAPIKNTKLKETEEKVRAEYSDVTEYLTKIGSEDGIDIYYKPKDISAVIWDKNGGEPEKKSEMTNEQEALSDVIGELRKLGDFVAADPLKKELLAEFKTSNKCGEGRVYVSTAGRYLLYTNEELSKVIKIRQVISTVDDPYLFRSSDGKTLEAMDSDYRKVLSSYTEKGVEDGKKVYLTDGGKGFAWLSENGEQVIAVCRECAENDNFVLLVDDRLGNLGLKNKKTGYIWWSSPLGASRDKIATPLLVNELRSSSTLRYGIPSKRSNNNVLRSGTDDCEISVSDIKNGVKVTYNYKKTGFKYPVEYTLEDDCLKASLKVSEIKEPKEDKIATEVTLLSSFGAASDTEDGCFVIPDGSGALVRFNNGKTMDSNSYQQRVYGQDVTAVPTSRGAVTEQIYLPVYGIVKEDNALLAVASKGDSNAYLSTYVSKQSNSSFNLCYFTFILRETDTFYMSGSNSDKLTVFENGNILSDDIEMRYYPISQKDADFTDVAERYRRYLIEEKGVTPKTEDGPPLNVDFYGGALKKKSVLGIPVTMKQTATKYGEAAEIVSELKTKGVDSMAVTYNCWNSDGISRKVSKKASASGTLGGSSGLDKLKSVIDENGFSLAPAYDNTNFYSGNGYYAFSDTCVRVSGSYSRIVSYDRAYGIPDGFKENMSLLSPDCFTDVYGTIAKNCADKGFSEVSVSGMASCLYGDYGKKEISRYKAMQLAEESLKALSNEVGEVSADCANAYALPYLSRISSVPLSSSRFDIFNEDIPFYQAVMHGLIPYSSTAVNSDPDPDTLLMMSALTGSELNYDMVYCETSDLKDTDLDVYFYANYADITDTAALEYKLFQPLLSRISSSTLTDYRYSNDTATAVYSDGTEITADFRAKTINYGGMTIDLAKLAKGDV